MNYQIKSIVHDVEHTTLANDEPVSLLFLNSEKVLAITQNAMGLYSSKDAIHDPLGNGLLCITDFPQGHTLQLDDQVGHFVTHFDAGFVSLSQGRALLIKPHCVEYYPSPMEGLQGKNMICQLLFPNEQLFS